MHNFAQRADDELMREKETIFKPWVNHSNTKAHFFSSSLNFNFLFFCKRKYIEDVKNQINLFSTL